ncbi:MAG: hypothetical protein ACREHG_10580 [Candidatus Saccharimonadales bacterium]
MDVWNFPVTWQVGDLLDADTLNARIRDQNNILLRRPLLAAHSTTNQSGATSSWTSVTFDTIDNDDDGMALEATPVSDFYAQRAGVYQVWANVDFRNPGGGNTYALALWLNGLSSNIEYRQQKRMGGFGTTIDFGHSLNGIIFLGVGDFVELRYWNGSGTDVLNVQATNNCPSIRILWLGPN